MTKEDPEQNSLGTFHNYDDLDTPLLFRFQLKLDGRSCLLKLLPSYALFTDFE